MPDYRLKSVKDSQAWREDASDMKIPRDIFSRSGRRNAPKGGRLQHRPRYLEAVADPSLNIHVKAETVKKLEDAEDCVHKIQRPVYDIIPKLINYGGEFPNGTQYSVRSAMSTQMRAIRAAIGAGDWDSKFNAANPLDDATFTNIFKNKLPAVYLANVAFDGTPADRAAQAGSGQRGGTVGADGKEIKSLNPSAPNPVQGEFPPQPSGDDNSGLEGARDEEDGSDPIASIIEETFLSLGRHYLAYVNGRQQYANKPYLVEYINRRAGQARAKFSKDRWNRLWAHAERSNGRDGKYDWNVNRIYNKLYSQVQIAHDFDMQTNKPQLVTAVPVQRARANVFTAYTAPKVTTRKEQERVMRMTALQASVQLAAVRRAQADRSRVTVDLSQAEGVDIVDDERDGKHGPTRPRNLSVKVPILSSMDESEWKALAEAKWRPGKVGAIAVPSYAQNANFGIATLKDIEQRRAAFANLVEAAVMFEADGDFSGLSSKPSDAVAASAAILAGRYNRYTSALNMMKFHLFGQTEDDPRAAYKVAASALLAEKLEGDLYEVEVDSTSLQLPSDEAMMRLNANLQTSLSALASRDGGHVRKHFSELLNLDIGGLDARVIQLTRLTVPGGKRAREAVPLLEEFVTFILQEVDLHERIEDRDEHWRDEVRWLTEHLTKVYVWLEHFPMRDQVLTTYAKQMTKPQFEEIFENVSGYKADLLDSAYAAAKKQVLEKNPNPIRLGLGLAASMSRNSVQMHAHLTGSVGTISPSVFTAAWKSLTGTGQSPSAKAATDASLEDAGVDGKVEAGVAPKRPGDVSKTVNAFELKTLTPNQKNATLASCSGIIDLHTSLFAEEKTARFAYGQNLVAKASDKAIKLRNMLTEAQQSQTDLNDELVSILTKMCPGSVFVTNISNLLLKHVGHPFPGALVDQVLRDSMLAFVHLFPSLKLSTDGNMWHTTVYGLITAFHFKQIFRAYFNGDEYIQSNVDVEYFIANFLSGHRAHNGIGWKGGGSKLSFAMAQGNEPLGVRIDRFQPNSAESDAVADALFSMRSRLPPANREAYKAVAEYASNGTSRLIVSADAQSSAADDAFGHPSTFIIQSYYDKHLLELFWTELTNVEKFREDYVSSLSTSWGKEFPLDNSSDGGSASPVSKFVTPMWGEALNPNGHLLTHDEKKLLSETAKSVYPTWLTHRTALAPSEGSESPPIDGAPSGILDSDVLDSDPEGELVDVKKPASFSTPTRGDANSRAEQVMQESAELIRRAKAARTPGPLPLNLEKTGRGRGRGMRGYGPVKSRQTFRYEPYHRSPTSRTPSFLTAGRPESSFLEPRLFGRKRSRLELFRVPRNVSKKPRFADKPASQWGW